MFFPLAFAVVMGLLLNGGTIEGTQAIATHESLCTAKLCDRTADDITLGDIEWMGVRAVLIGERSYYGITLATDATHMLVV